VLGDDRLLGEVTSSTGILADIADGADLTTHVPTCPEWTLRQLFTHVGRAHRWATAIVATRAAEPIPMRAAPDGRLPDDPAEHPAWLRRGAAGLAEAVHGAGSDPLWTHFGTGTAGYWARRMAHETAVHRADGQLAVGQQPQLDPVVAADGIDEWLGFLTMGSTGDTPALPDGAVLHLHVTDPGITGEWLVRGGGDGRISVEPGHGKGDTAVRGPASVLLLTLLRRLPADDPAVQVLGDRSLLDGWLGATPF
jgi:uncharacterized protein (TIGR03083 family)